MTQIKIEVPANDTIALNAFAEALQRIASERTHVDLTPKQIAKAETNTAYAEALQRIASERDTTAHHSGESQASKYGKTVMDYIKNGPDEEPLNDVAIDALDKELGTIKLDTPVPSMDDLPRGEPVEDANQAFETLEREQFKTPDRAGSYESLPPENKDGIEEDSCVGQGLDKDGIPWDGRIHSKGKSRLTDDTWRLRKRPADKDEDEWSAYVESVKSELKAVQDAPVTQPLSDEQVEQLNDYPIYKPGVIAPDCKVEVTLEGVTPNGDTVTVTDAEAGEPCPQVTPPSAVVPPVAAVTPPTSLTPPPASEASESDVTTFPQLMKYITSDAAKRGATNDLVKQALVKTDPSLIAIPLIGGRIDLIPQFIKNLEELIGE